MRQAHTVPEAEADLGLVSIHVKIITVEEPAEYRIPELVQVRTRERVWG